MASNAFSAITILLRDLSGDELEVLALLLNKMRIKEDGFSEANETTDDESEEDESPFSMQIRKSLDEWIADRGLVIKGEEYEGDSLPYPRVTKEQLDQELEEYLISIGR